MTKQKLMVKYLKYMLDNPTQWFRMSDLYFLDKELPEPKEALEAINDLWEIGQVCKAKFRGDVWYSVVQSTEQPWEQIESVEVWNEVKDSETVTVAEVEAVRQKVAGANRHCND